MRFSSFCEDGLRTVELEQGIWSESGVADGSDYTKDSRLDLHVSECNLAGDEIAFHCGRTH
jgi:hypothetical protein